MQVPIYQVDAFTERVFGGNPAAVCPLDAWLPDDTLQSIAVENNLSETAFLVARGGDFELRWFTPKLEVELCGHATLASAWVVFERLRTDGSSSVTFHTKSGRLVVAKKSGKLRMDFPSQPGTPCDPPAGLIDALGGNPVEIRSSVRDLLAVYGSESEVRALAPDERGLLSLDPVGVIASAPGDEAGVDFVSRFFAPKAGIYEDPVTGSAHCVTIPYWSERLGKKELRARQISKRGGDLWCEDHGERVSIAGSAVLYLEGEIAIP